jgi:hypothetical protein
MVEVLAARFTKSHSSLVSGPFPCQGLARDTGPSDFSLGWKKIPSDAARERDAMMDSAARMMQTPFGFCFL